MLLKNIILKLSRKFIYKFYNFIISLETSSVYIPYYFFIKCNYYCKVRIQIKGTKNSSKRCTTIDGKSLG